MFMLLVDFLPFSSCFPSLFLSRARLCHVSVFRVRAVLIAFDFSAIDFLRLVLCVWFFLRCAFLRCAFLAFDFLALWHFMTAKAHHDADFATRSSVARRFSILALIPPLPPTVAYLFLAFVFFQSRSLA